MKTIKDVLNYVVLPKPVSAFEAQYLERVNRIGLAFFAVHVPALMLIAWFNGTKPLAALVLGLLALTGPTAAYRALSNPRHVSVVHGITAMFFGGLLVHFGQGPMQIEMHFYFFALIAMLTVFGNPMVIVAAAVTVALHHLALWFVASRSVFNYEASVWVVLVHASFVVLESIAACYIARSFFDNVIGLEKIVEARTAELDARNRDMRLVLDNVDQGFVTIDLTGKLSLERSQTFDKWFGSGHDDVFAALGAKSEAFASSLRFAIDELAAAILPADLLLDQMPKGFRVNETEYAVSYLPIGAAEPPEKLLLVITDVTAQVKRQRAERDEREAMLLVERLLSSTATVQDFIEESSSLVETITTPNVAMDVLKRRVHTLKGNTAIFGLETVASLCHDFETHIAEQGDAPPVAELAKLESRWGVLRRTAERLLGARHRVIELQPEEHMALEAEARKVSPGLARRIRELRYEPTRQRLGHFGEQAMRVAARLDKRVDVKVNDHGLRVEPKAWAPLWGALVHAVRNAIDHGLETPAERIAAGKTAQGLLTLSTAVTGDRFVIEVADDGRGVDWTRVRMMARERGLPADTSSDLKAALFADGLSTAREVTDVSGRGVGMGALLDAAQSLDGLVDIDSQEGRGTRVRMIFPVEAMWKRRGDTAVEKHAPALHVA